MDVVVVKLDEINVADVVAIESVVAKVAGISNNK